MAQRKGLGDGAALMGDALRQAARVNDTDKIKELLNKGADVNSFYVRRSKRNATSRPCPPLTNPR